MDGGAPPDDADDGVTIVRLASAASQDVRRPLSAALGAAVLWLCPAFYLAVREDLATFGGPLVRVVMPGAALALLVLGALAARHCLLTLRPRHAIIGADGVCFAGAFDQVFVPFGEVAEVRLEPNGTSLRTRAGGLVLMPVAPASFRAERAASEDPRLAARNELHDRIRAARRKYEEARPRPPDERLDRNGRSISLWRADLLRVAGDAGPYRGSTTSLDDLRQVIEDAYAPADRRIAAALVVALRTEGQAAAATRLAVQRSADPDLRVALDGASRGKIDEDALARLAERERR
jgi:hypothetical protein